MKLKEEANQLFKVLLWFVQFDVEDLNVSRCSTTDLLVVGIADSRCLVRTHESNGGALDRAWELLLKVLAHILFSPPVTSGSQCQRGRESFVGGGRRWGDGRLSADGLSHEISGVQKLAVDPSTEVVDCGKHCGSMRVWNDSQVQHRRSNNTASKNMGSSGVRSWEKCQSMRAHRAHVGWISWWEISQDPRRGRVAASKEAVPASLCL